jgi:putative ATP-binding cassette transporter
LLGVIVTLTLGLVFLNVLYNDWNRAFFEALQERDVEAFGPLLLRFGMLASLFILGAVFRRYLTQMLQMNWRIWMTRNFLDRWMGSHTFYRLETAHNDTDNPDQRIADDLRMFTFNTIDLSLGLLSSVVTLVSFVQILWTISGPLVFAIAGVEFEIGGYMVWVALGYAIIGSLLTHRVGRPLIGLNYQEQRVEADLRFSLIRLREQAEGVALYRGEATERNGLEGRLGAINRNWRGLMRATKSVTFLTTAYDQLAEIFPLLVAAPRYFSGAISLGVLTQIGNAFGQVQGSLSWFVNSYGALAGWKATVDRLVTFEDAMARAEEQARRTQRIRVAHKAPTRQLVAADLQLLLPDGRPVLPTMNLTIEPGEHVLINGPTGVGKSTLFRALAGIWPFGTGEVNIPAGARLLFLPQRPYLPIASLRDAVSYPSAAGTFDDAQIREVLTETGLAAFGSRLDEVDNWTQQLSGGEQQRVALARAILQQPEWLFLDEATAALDEPSERDLYELLRRRLPEAAIISIAHRSGVAAYHERQLTLGTPPPARALGLAAD